MSLNIIYSLIKIKVSFERKGSGKSYIEGSNKIELASARTSGLGINTSIPWYSIGN